jgi:hypothetical protein
MKAKSFLRAGLAVAVACVMAAAVRAARVIYSQNLVDESALAYNATYTLDMGNANLPGSNVDQISFQAVYTSATVAAVSFNDGVKSTGTINISTITFSRTNLIGARASITLDVANNAATDGDQGTVKVNVASNTYLAANNVALDFAGNRVVSNRDYTVASTSATTATNLAAVINNIPGFTAAASGSTVTITCANIGAACNGYSVLSSASSRLVPSASSFSGGTDNTYFTLNGKQYTQGYQWSMSDVSSNTALSIASAINAEQSGIFTASLTSGSTVTITVVSTGTAGNGYTLTTSAPTVLRINTSSVLTSSKTLNGVNETVVYVGTNTLTQSIDWTAQTTASGTAKAISDAIQANMNSLVSSTWSMVATSSFGVVNATYSVVGPSGNIRFYSNKPTILNFGTGAFTNGSNSNVASNVVTKASHNLTTGLPVLYTKTSGTDPQNLIANTTYYAIRLGANTFSLASSAANATAASPTAITISTVTGSGAFVLTPLAITGTPSFKWQYSNDNATWGDVSVSSVTMASYTLGGATTVWDFGSVNYRYLRLNVLAPTTGGIYLKVIGIGKASQ